MPKSIWQVYHSTRGVAGSYIDTLQEAFSDCQIPSLAFVSYSYRFSSTRVVRAFFPLTDRTERRTLLLYALRGVELCLAYLGIFLCACACRPIVNIHLVDDTSATYVFVRLCTLARLVVHVTCHDVVPHAGVIHPRRRAIISLASRLIVHNSHAIELLCAHYGEECARRVMVFPFPFGRLDARLPSKCSGPLGAPNSLPVDGPYLLLIGVVRGTKGVRTLLAAWSRCKSYSRWKLVIAGKWAACDPQLKGEAMQLHNCVIIDRYLGDDEFVSLVRAARFVVLPYGEYTHSSVLYVAIDLSVPVLASDTPLFQDTLSGYSMCFHVDDSTALANLIDRASATDDRYRSELISCLVATRIAELAQLRSALIANYRHEQGYGAGPRQIRHLHSDVCKPVNNLHRDSKETA